MNLRLASRSAGRLCPVKVIALSQNRHRSLLCRQPATCDLHDRFVTCGAEAAAAPGAPEQHAPSMLEKVADKLATLFPLWVFIGASLGIAKPEAVTWFGTTVFTYALGFLMLSMGLTLTVADFKRCVERPAPILASNVATFIAHGDVALSVLMTTASTIGAIFMTPLLTQLLAGTLVPVDSWALMKDVFQVVLVPTVTGVALNELFNPIVKKIKPLLPLIGVLITTMLCASPVGQVSGVLRASGLELCLPVALLHAFAFAMGYFICKLLKFNEKTARTVSIETGMQSAALGFLLAQKNFADPLVAVPSAVSVVFMAIGGSGLAVFWRGRPVKDDAALTAA